MKLSAAQSLTAWLWDQHPEIVYALARQVPRPLGQCFSCDVDLFTDVGGCDGSALFTSVSCSSLAIDPISLDASSLDNPFTSCGLDTIGTDIGGCIPTLTESDLTTVPTCAVTLSGGCNTNVTCGASVTSTDAATANSLSGVAGFVTSAAGLTALAKVAAAYFQAQAASSQMSAAQAAAQAAIVNAQTARAAAGQSALPVTYVANGVGSTTPMISTTGGLVPLTSSILSALTPSSIAVFFAQYGNWILIGGAAAFLAYAASRKRAT